MKPCGACKTMKPVSDYYRRFSKATGKPLSATNTCKACKIKQVQERKRDRDGYTPERSDREDE